MPIYEFECAGCGARFEQLVAVGTSNLACPECGAEGARRLYSAPGAPFKVVKTPGEARKQERKNVQLREGAKRRLKEARARQAGGGER